MIGMFPTFTAKYETFSRALIAALVSLVNATSHHCGSWMEIKKKGERLMHRPLDGQLERVFRLDENSELVLLALADAGERQEDGHLFTNRYHFPGKFLGILDVELHPAELYLEFLLVLGADGFSIDRSVKVIRLRYTPLPFLKAVGNIVGGILSMPFMAHLYREYATRNEAKSNDKVLNMLACAFNITGCLGYAWSGLISLDISKDVHNLFSMTAIVGFGVGGVFIGILALKNHAVARIPAWIAGYMVVVPVTLAILFIIDDLFPSREFYEWMLFFSIQGWIIYLFIHTFNHQQSVKKINK